MIYTRPGRRMASVNHLQLFYSKDKTHQKLDRKFHKLIQLVDAGLCHRCPATSSPVHVYTVSRPSHGHRYTWAEPRTQAYKGRATDTGIRRPSQWHRHTRAEPMTQAYVGRTKDTGIRGSSHGHGHTSAELRTKAYEGRARDTGIRGPSHEHRHK